MTYLSELDTTQTVQAKVLSTERITPPEAAEVRQLQLQIEQPDFTYHVGQHVGVNVPGPHAFGHNRHFRLYTIANYSSDAEATQARIELCVRRCSYIDEFSGEEEPGIASNYLCDLKPGDSLTLSGPYGEAFALPEDPDSNLLMIGSGTGIAPFRAFVQHIYQMPERWRGKVMLFYGARSGAENLYRNDYRQDFDNYYDQQTFQAFEGLSERPWMEKEEEGLDNVLSEHAEAIWEMLEDPATHVYLAGLESTRDRFESIMQQVAGSKSRWHWTREEMIEQDRWAELIYS
jgi:ferredoxin--NADP+ reductase